MGCALPKPARSRPNPAAPPERQGNNQPSNVHRYIPTQQGWPPWLMELSATPSKTGLLAAPTPSKSFLRLGKGLIAMCTKPET
ncbi:uncharacterized protein DS421_3g88870 [Arachis hypogaea]|nr:uncharacterized protein DS421_3g88870 [Arachis hypogaea]